MKKLKRIDEIENGQVMLVFSGTWCGDCIALEQYIDQIIERYHNWDFYYVERDEFIDLAKFYNIYGIPSFVALSDGDQVGDFVSKEAKSYEEICSFIDELERKM